MDKAELEAIKYDSITKFEALTAEARNALPGQAFIFPGERRYPIHDRAHAANALARASGKPEWATVRRKVCKKYPDLPACKIEHSESEEGAMWLEIFRTGTHTANNGVTKTYTEDDLKGIASKYNSQKDSEAPLVLGHPKTDDPAYGWTKSLAVSGGRLYAFVDQISSKLKEANRAGMFKTVSLALNADGTLRHIGLLGATPPAVQGLAPVQFAEGVEFSSYDYKLDEEEEMTLIKQIKELFYTLFTDKKTEILNGGTQDMDEKKFADLEARFAVQGAQIATLLTTVETLKSNNEALRTEMASKDNDHAIEIRKIQLQNEQSSFSNYLDTQIFEGKVLPAEKDVLLAEFSDLYQADNQLQYSKDQKSLVVRMKERIEARTAVKPNVVRFATHDKALTFDVKDVPREFNAISSAVDGASIDMHMQILEYQKANAGMTYEKAAEAVSKQ